MSVPPFRLVTEPGQIVHTLLANRDLSSSPLARCCAVCCVHFAPIYSPNRLISIRARTWPENALRSSSSSHRLITKVGRQALLLSCSAPDRRRIRNQNVYICLTVFGVPPQLAFDRSLDMLGGAFRTNCPIARRDMQSVQRHSASLHSGTVINCDDGCLITVSVAEIDWPVQSSISDIR